MSNLLNSLKLIKIVGIDDHEKLQKCFNVSVDPMSEIEKFTDTEQGINHVIMAMNEGFNLLYKHREAYKTLAGMDVDAALTGFHQLELQFEAAIDQE